MKKMKGKFSLLVGAIMLLISCSPKGDYVNVLPRDASVVAAFDFATMAEKGGLNEIEGERLITKLTDALTSGLSEKATRTIERIIRHPSESGLSFTDKVFLFTTPNSGTIGLLAKVESRSKVENLLKVFQDEHLLTPLRNEDDCTWTQMGEALCAYNHTAFLFLASNTSDASSLQNTLLMLMRQDTERSYAATPDFARLQTAQGEVDAIISLSALPTGLTARMRIGMSADLKLEDIRCLFSVRFLPGRITVNAETLTENTTWQLLCNEQVASTAPLDGHLLDYYSAGTLFWAGGHLNGRGLYELLCQNATVRQALENPFLPIDMKTIFSAIQGNLCVGYSSFASDELLAYADVTNTDFLQTIENLRPLLALSEGRLKLLSDGPYRYEFRVAGQRSLWFGVKDNHLFYLSTNKRLADEAGRSYGASLQQMPWSGDVTQARIFLALNASRLTDDMTKVPRMRDSFSWLRGKNSPLLRILLAPCAYATLSVPDWKRAQLNMVMKDKGTNILRLLIHEWEEQ